MIKYLFLFYLFLNLHTNFYAQKIESISNGKNSSFENLHKINDSIFRSEQPNKYGIVALEKLGIKSILSLRNIRSDKFLQKHSKLFYAQERINAWTMSENQLINALQLLQSANKPVLIHCVHGSDRTGAVIAAYRIIFENWSKDKALAEMTESRFGFHENFQNLVLLIKKLDVEKVKNKLNNSIPIKK